MASAEASDEQMSEMLARMASVLFSEQTLDSVLQLVVSVAVEALQPEGAASVTLRLDGTEVTSNASSDWALSLDDAQYASDRGPCLTATRTGTLLNVRLEVDDPRWPEFATSAREHGVTQSLSAPLFVAGEPQGALNLYSRSRGPFEDKDSKSLVLLAEQSSTVLANAVAFMRADRLNEQLAEALASRETIGQATGIVMASEAIGPSEAFDVLRRMSQRSNRKLRDIAAEIVDATGRERRAEG